MAGSGATPVYGWQYYTLADTPDIPDATQGLALDAEATVSTLAASVASIAGAMPFRARTKLAAPAATITIGSIPTTLRSLRVRWLARGNDAAPYNAMYMRVNGSSAAVYSQVFYENNGAGLTRVTAVGSTAVNVGICVQAGSTAGFFGAGLVDFIGWDSVAATAGLTWLYKGAADMAFGVVDDGFAKFGAVGPYTSLTFFPAAGSFVAGTDIQLVGEVA